MKCMHFCICQVHLQTYTEHCYAFSGCSYTIMRALQGVNKQMFTSRAQVVRKRNQAGKSCATQKMLCKLSDIVSFFFILKSSYSSQAKLQSSAFIIPGFILS